ncbi:VTT domain-containing protein [Desulfatitalea tepidiphila]|uniref:VTT domain-containing protein n=1 Tax=Desulfatitalea tepidiphila TaxID=1185843 RepID=UPI0006B478B3|nr:VTT domain-containing protein [Desulfatitalea tepidiphila]
MGGILEKGRNCWRLAQVERAAFVIDGEDYFRAVREAMCRARRTIFIVGWDIHSELRLVRNGQDDGYPEKLGQLLDRLADDRRELEIYILNWDFAMIYAMEREFFPVYKLRWKSHQRIHFSLDGQHPVGASQHQKIVVVDDRVAFVGGLDLSKWRWDTSRHHPDDERRVDPDGKAYPPFHDVQMAIDGEAAAAMGQLVRERWRAAVGQDAAALDPNDGGDPWPPSIQPDLEKVTLGIARTLPDYGGRDEIREVERLYLESIEAAQSFIYIENQYLSAHCIGEALSRRLEQSDAPEVVLVLPEKTGGWLEQHTMDVLRGRLLAKLRHADRHDRLRVYYVRLSKDPHVSLMVHAKAMIVDDRIARVGSSNLSNRSMGLDSECDIAVEVTESQPCGAAVARFRHRLLAEHLGVDVDEVAAAQERHGSLIAAIESMRGGRRTLEPLSGDVPQEIDQWVPDSALLDPEKPVEPDAFFDQFIPSDQQKPAYRHMLRIGLLLLGVAGLAAMWRWTPMSDWLAIERVESALHWIAESPLTPPLVLAAFVVGGIVVVPITLLIVATVTVFGPWLGAAYALLGAEASALVTFGLGHLLGREAVSRIAGSRINRIDRALSNRGVLTIVTLRIVPVAPFSVINVIAGVSEIRLRDFAIGSFIGMVPGVVTIALLADRIVASLREPGVESILILVAVAVCVILFLAGLRYLVRRKREPGKA